MAASFFALFDDIATALDDVAVMTKAATQKTAGVLGDDLALNANQVAGVKPERELPVVWAVTKGSLVNKVILVPIALILNALLPWSIPVLLMLGGAYLTYEGVEKVIHVFFHHHEDKARQKAHAEANAQQKDLVQEEKDKISGAIRTDFILSAEIIVIAMSVLIANNMSLTLQIITLSLIALLITLFIYGTVAIIVKMDDVGLYWVNKYDGIMATLGKALLWIAPRLLKLLSIVGTLAMFIVGGHIWIEGIEPLHHWVAHILHDMSGFTKWITSTGLDIAVGAVVGIAAVAIMTPILKLWPKKQGAASGHY